MNKSLFLVVILTCFSSYLQAENESTTSDCLLQRLAENRYFCVEKCEGDRIFIKPENINSIRQGLVLDLNEYEQVPLPLLQFSESGCFLESPFYITKGKTRGPCGNCDEPTDAKGVCQNPACFFYKMRVN